MPAGIACAVNTRRSFGFSSMSSFGTNTISVVPGKLPPLSAPASPMPAAPASVPGGWFPVPELLQAAENAAL